MATLRLLHEGGKFVTEISNVSYVEGSSGDVYIEKENGAHFSMKDVVVDQFQAGDE